MPGITPLRGHPKHDNAAGIRDTSAQDVARAAPAPRSRARWLWIAGGIAAALLLGTLARGWMSGEKSVDASRLRIATVTRGPLVRDIVADGTVIAADSPTLYAVAPGIVTLDVVPGDGVKQGQPLASIDSPELRSRLAQEQASLASAQAEVGRAQLNVRMQTSVAQKSLDQAQVDLQAALREQQRMQRAFSLGAIAQVEVLRAQDNVAKARIALDHAQQDRSLQIDEAGFDLQTKRQLADRQRALVADLQRQVDSLVVRSPVDGQVGQVLVAQRANVAANAPVLSVVDLTKLVLEIKVPESFARDLAIGMPAQISGNGSRFSGQVIAVAPEVVGGEVTARLRFNEQRPAGLRQNQRLSARIVLDRKADAIQVERGAFVDTNGGTSAWFVRGDSAERRPIRIGVTSLDAVEIAQGAQPGDRIVVSGDDQFGNAKRVRISR
ncbi:MAG: efflux RND transporter periplasmic adaptor subunit [Proteobacteria bacterium]|nr:efflux RND transporter periplasmic adaptor subunit [Pseudomonadota bacterium]